MKKYRICYINADKYLDSTYLYADDIDKAFKAFNLAYKSNIKKLEIIEIKRVYEPVKEREE